jgi:hypothetical protein
MTRIPVIPIQAPRVNGKARFEPGSQERGPRVSRDLG